MKISEQKKEKIYEQILALLYSISPQSLFTLNIAKELARDEEFIKLLLLNLKKKDLVIEIKKNPKGMTYLKRSRWKLSDTAYQAYKKHQPTQNQQEGFRNIQ
jgi:hypothetical protein